jgi:hypothetical protein
MMLNPSQGVTSIEGTPFANDGRLTQYLGARVLYGDPRRSWTIQSFLLPSRKRALGGLRAKLQDQKGFITFCNQRDLEVLLGLGNPYEVCFWLGKKYAEPGDNNWVGFFSDEEDLRDDLYERELLIRSDYPLMPEGMSITRLIHIEDGADVEETHMFLGDWDRETGLSPDPRYETVHSRWVRVERIRATWELLAVTV